MDRDETRDRERMETVKDDVRDTVDEAKERVKAGGERVNRTVQGGSMPIDERLGSHVREMGHDIKADVDRAKRELRDDAAQEDGI